MFEFKVETRRVKLVWFIQSIVTSSTQTNYGFELLTRAYFVDSDSVWPTQQLFQYLTHHPKLLLEITTRQIKDIADVVKQPIYHDSKFWINLSAPLIANESLFNQLWKFALQPILPILKERIVLEISEECVSDFSSIEHMKLLQSSGLKLALDDFGSGYSNLQRLNQLAFDFIKIDLGLINQVPVDIWQSSFYQQTIELCSSIGGLIVAEGVETQAQADFVQWAGADLIQGFFFSRPAPLR